ncbi:MAG TPA: decaprenyl-phosphate phosphoribosyltransferase [Egibacteraceae bacterium]|nr:decaprenyl-phosphate phosphoribosyltransferase [Actinomycetota bacterium]HWB71399.1 decaprenyl-phosphate phosphoribosyltransferase [Egibacteraceae bacterium]
MARPRSSRGPDDVVSAPASAPQVAPRGSLLLGLWTLARPRQWLKNALVLAAPGAAGVLTDPGVLALTAVGFACFCLAASGTYYLNDAFDAHADRLHPRKRHRPVAAGTVPVTLAKVLGGGLVVGSVVAAGTVANAELAAVLSGYVVLMGAYSGWLKQVPVVELAVVASGFIFRAIAGGVATDVPLSRWFVIVVSFASLFVVVGKRFAEQATLGDGSEQHRSSLGEYSPAFLQLVGAISAAVAIIAYCLWALTRAGGGMLWYELSIAPFVLGMLHYALQAEKGRAGAPEEVFLKDRTLQVLGLLWAVLFAAGVYGP